MNILWMQKQCSQSEQLTEKDKFIFSSLGKVLKKEAEKQVDAIKVFRLF